MEAGQHPGEGEEIMTELEPNPPSDRAYIPLPSILSADEFEAKLEGGIAEAWAKKGILYKPATFQPLAVLELPVVIAASLGDKPAPPRSWHVRDMVPGRTVTQLGGDGGLGKSTIGMQLGVATSIDKPWLGMSARLGPVIYLSAEDDLDELHRRLEAIAASYGTTVADLTDLHLLPMAGLDTVLGAPGERGVISPTEIWRALLRLVERIKPCLVILDTLADVFAGNENARLEVRTFVGMLRGLAIEHDLAVVLLAHPSLSGMASGAGTSGSTAWNNSVRSRLYLEGVKGEGGREVDADLRVLRVMKTNYGPPGLELTLKWYQGCFVREGADGAPGGLDRLTAQARDERIFLDLVAAFNAQGRDVSPYPSRTYAPTVFASHPDAEGAKKVSLEDAMNRLLKEGRIKIETFGPPSKLRSRLVAVPTEDREGSPEW
jgi:hypothetical protein